jgi:hypothetical protein
LKARGRVVNSGQSPLARERCTKKMQQRGEESRERD